MYEENKFGTVHLNIHYPWQASLAKSESMLYL